MFLYHAGRYDEAIVQFQRVLDLDPNYRLALMFMSRTLVEQGKFDEAIAAARKAQENSKEAADPLTYEAYALGKSGRRTAASAILKRFLSESDHRYVSPYNTALIYSAIGDDENALKHLEKAYAEKDIRMVFLGVEPKWGALRSEPRFIELLKKMNL
jgi:tetratricopeptide (TPR) repeat protein